MKHHVFAACLASMMLVLAGCGGGQDGDQAEDQSAQTAEETAMETAKETAGAEDEAASGKNIVEEPGENWVGISGKVVLKGTKPKPAEHEPKSECKLHEGQGKIVVERAEVSEDGGIGEVFVWLEPKEGTSFQVLKPALSSSSETIDQKGCRFHPENLILQKGGSLTVKNSDKGSHNFKYEGTFLSGNFDQEAGATDAVDDLPADPQFITFQCNIHPWMTGLLRIADHHAYALTGKDGSFDLDQVPPGEYTLNLRHELLDEAKTIDVTVKEDGTVEGVDLAKIELQLKS